MKKSLILLNKIKSLSFEKIEAIINHFKDVDNIFKAKRSDFLQVRGLKEKDIENIISSRCSKEIDQELRLIDKEKITILDIFDKDYPKLLRQVSRPPLVLYIKGRVEVLDKFCFAIVGTRLATVYGLSMAEKFSYNLSSLGMMIVSGLARGIDTAAHKAALRAGQTIAVLGSGLLHIYPRENENLAERIVQSGALVSEFPLKEPPYRENFPRRNRIISGLSKGVLIVEAPQRSGALITARYALEQNREVFALPGKADSPLSKGTHFLIKAGAKLVDSLEDVLEELNIKWTKFEKDFNLNSEEKTIFDIIDSEGLFLEEIILKSGLKRPLVNKAILTLQVKGLIEERRTFYFARKTYG